MKLEAHEKESLVLFGKPYTEVHLWLDAFAGTLECGMRHRRKRHHKAGIREAEKLFGEEGALAAKLHIISDLKEEGCVFRRTRRIMSGWDFISSDDELGTGCTVYGT
jgi:hypothetical protein